MGDSGSTAANLNLAIDDGRARWVHERVSRQHYYDADDDKYGKAKWQRQRAFYGYCSRDSAGFLCASILLLLFAVGAIVFGVGYSSLPGLDKPPPTTNEDGGDGLDLSGVSGDSRRGQRLSLTCPATQEMIEGVCVRKFDYPLPLDRSMMDESSEPCEDFYDYACGSYAYDPRNVGQDATFTYMYADNAQMIHTAICDAPKETQLGKFYHTCLEHESEPFDISHYTILPRLLSIVTEGLTRSSPSSSPLEEVIGELMQWDVLLPFRFSLELNPLHTRSTLPTFVRAGLSEEPEYVGSDHHLAYIRKRLQFVAGTLGWPPSKVQRNAELVVEVEKRLIEGWPTDAEEEENLVPYIGRMKEEGGDLMTYAAFKAVMAPAFDVDAFLRSFTEADGPPLGQVWVFKERYFQRLSRAFAQLSTEHWSAYLIHSILFSVIDPAPSHTPDLYYVYHHGYDAEHALPWKRRSRFTTYDSLAVTNRQQRCLQITAAYLPIVVDEYFVEEIPAFGRAKRAVKQMMKAIKEELARQIRPFEEKAAEKVLSIDVMAGTPDNWPIDRSTLTIAEDSHADNILRVRRFHQRLMVETMCAGCGVTPEALFDYPLYWVNAYYQHQLNTIVINAGIMKPPVFSALYNEVGQMARLGVIVGHEAGHSIDMTGSLFDSTGSFDQWLTDSSRYEDNAQCFVDLYTERTRYGNLHNGALTLNENIADIVGFRAAFNVMFGGGGDASTEEEVRQKKRDFFLVYAQTWCQASTAEQERQYIETSVHSTGRMRVNKVVTQVEDFYEVFECQERPPAYCNIFRNLLLVKNRDLLL